MNKALIDTDILSELGKGIDPIVARHAMTYRGTFGRYTLSVVTLMEIVRGFQRNLSTRRLNAFLTSIAAEEVLPFDPATAELAGCIAGDLEHIGLPIGMADPMIAATALEHGLELVTGNTSHFQRIQQLGYPLTVANWRI